MSAKGGTLPLPNDLFTRAQLDELYAALFNNTQVLANVSGLTFSTAQKAVKDPSAVLSLSTIEKLQRAYEYVVLGGNTPRPLPDPGVGGGRSLEVATVLAGQVPADAFVPDPSTVTRQCDSCHRHRQVPGDYYKYFKDRPELRGTCKHCMNLERAMRRLGLHSAEKLQLFRVFLGEVRWPPDPEDPVWLERAKNWVRRKGRVLGTSTTTTKPLTDPKVKRRVAARAGKK